MRIESNRLLMKQISSKDWELFKRLKTEPQVIKWCWDEPSEAEIEEQFESRIQKWHRHHQGWLSLVVQEVNTGKTVGITGFKLVNGHAEVGYLFLPEFMGRGYATESLKAVIEWSSEQCHVESFSAIVTKGNVISEKVLTKCGFALSKIVPDSYEIGGQTHTDHVYTYRGTLKLEQFQ